MKEKSTITKWMGGVDLGSKEAGFFMKASLRIIIFMGSEGITTKMVKFILAIS